jgi:hypothetical protein
MKTTLLLITTFLSMWIIGCSSGSSSSDGGSSTTTRTVDSLTTVTGTVTTTVLGTSESCSQLSRDASSCESARTSLGLTGNWLKFSCNVAESLVNSSLSAVTSIASATYVKLVSTSLPDYKSNYFATTGSYSFTANGDTVSGNFSDLYSAFTTPFPDPGTIGAESITMYIPLNPAQAAAKSQHMGMGTVGMAINGVSIYDSIAAGTDNIFAEAGSFDQCQGHPAGTNYHYHSEPYSISYDDNQLIGVMRDGFFVYGRKDFSGSSPGSIANIQTAGTSADIYVYGGHTGVDPQSNSGTAFHYHLTEWKGCYHESGATKSADDGEVDDTLNPSPTCGGTWIDGWFLSGRGNGGVFATIPGGLTGQAPAQTAAGIRYYYGTPGSCTGCQ